jgi:hypothetical protein
LVSFFNWFISILFFNIRLVENWGLWFFFYLLSIRLSRSYYLSCEFLQVNLSWLE